MTQREAFEAWAKPILGDNPTWRESGDCELAWQAWQAAQPAQAAPRRLTEAEITLLVEAYYEDVGIAPPDLIRQVEGLIFGDAQPAQPGLPDCWVVLENGEIIGTHDAPVHIKGNAAIRYVPAQPAHAHAIDTSPERVEKQAGNVQVPLSAIRAIAVEAIRAVTGCPDIRGNYRYLVDEIEDVAKAAAQPAQVPEVEPVAWVLFRKDEDGLEPIQFYGGKDKPEGEFKDRFELRSVHLAPPDTEAGNMVQQPAQMPDYREIADCVLAGLEDRNGVLNLDVDADIEEEIRQEVADNIRMMLAAAPSTKEGQP